MFAKGKEKTKQTTSAMLVPVEALLMNNRQRKKKKLKINICVAAVSEKFSNPFPSYLTRELHVCHLFL